MSKKKDPLMDALAKSMTKKPAKKTAKKTTPIEPGTGEGTVTPKIKAKSISLYPADYDSIKTAKDTIYNHTGVMPNDSLTIRILIRIAHDSSELLNVFEELKLEDSRYKS